MTYKDTLLARGLERTRGKREAGDGEDYTERTRWLYDNNGRVRSVGTAGLATTTSTHGAEVDFAFRVFVAVYALAWVMWKS